MKNSSELFFYFDTMGMGLWAYTEQVSKLEKLFF